MNLADPFISFATDDATLGVLPIWRLLMIMLLAG